MAVIRRRISLRLNALRRVLLQPLLTQPLERGKRPGASFNGVGRGDEIGRRVRDISRGVGVLECLFPRVDGPGGDVDLLAHGHVERLQEGVHVLPAVELAEATQFGGDDGEEGVAGAVTVD